ncbi:carbohydrate:proton symporter [Malassezia pachydermatis]
MVERTSSIDDPFAEPAHAKSAKAYASDDGSSALRTAIATGNMERVGVMMWVLTMCAALCGSLFGYDTGYVSSVLVSLDQFGDFGLLGDGTKQFITSATSLGALIGSVCAMFPSDWFGRKAVIALANIVFIVGAIIQAAAHNTWTLIGGRFVVGIGVGIASMIVPLWIGELAPAHLRGRLVTLNVVFLTLGQLVATAVGAGFEGVHGGWRYTVAGGAIPAIISLATMAWLPESPRYDSHRGNLERAVRTFRRIYPHATEEYCRQRAEDLAQALHQLDTRMEKLPYMQRLRMLLTGPNARALAIACGLQAMQQLSGFNTLMYYSGTIFEAIGFNKPVAVSLIVSATNFLATLFALRFIDLIGRRRVLLWSVPIMVAALVFAAICFAFLPTTPSGDVVSDIPSGRKVWTYLIIVAFIIYVFFYGFGIGNVPWQQGELFAIETRAVGTSIATATNWACNLIIGATYLSLARAATSSGSFGFYAGLCAIGFVFCLFCFPDTRGLSLEEVHFIFRGSWGIRAAEELRNEKKRVAEEARARDAIEAALAPRMDSPMDASTTQFVKQPTHITVTRTRNGDGDLDAVDMLDPLDDYKSTSFTSSGTSGMNGSTPAALPLSLPSEIQPPELAPVRRSHSLPYLHDAAQSEIDVVHPPQVDASQSTNPLSRYLGMHGDALMMFVTCFASLGVFMFGYDQGVMSGILTHPAFKEFFEHPTAAQVGTMVAILEIGALLTSLLSGVLADRFGRKAVLVWGALLFSLGGMVQTCALGYRSMVVGRILSGFGVGFLSMIVPTYQSEVSPAENRGKLACIEFTGNIVGYMASVWFDYASGLLEGNMAWRTPLLVQPMIGLTLAFGSVLLPESPRWLCDQDRDKEAMLVLTDLHDKDDPRHVRAKLEFWEIKTSVLQMRAQGDRSYRTMWQRLRYRTLIGMSSQMFAQLNGINVISYYAPLVFESAGWIGRDAILMTGLNAIMYVLSTIPTWFLVDTWGRRPILLTGALLCALTLGACGLFLRANVSYTPTAVVACVILFNAAFGFSWGPIPWAWTPEIMPLAFRAKGSSLAAATNWVFNWIVGQLTPVLQEEIGWKLYLLHAFFCLCSFVVVYLFYPETQGVPLEEMDTLFGDEGAPIPQMDYETGEVRSSHGSDPEVCRVRRSISTHPRFFDDVQQEVQRRQRESAHSTSWLAQTWSRMTSAFGSQNRGSYEALPVDSTS